MKKLQSVISVLEALVIVSCTPSLQPLTPVVPGEQTDSEPQVEPEPEPEPEIVKTLGRTLEVSLDIWRFGNVVMYPDSLEGGFTSETRFELSEAVDSVKTEVVLTGIQYKSSKVIFDEGSRTQGTIYVHTTDKAVTGGTLMLRVTEAGESISDNWNESATAPIETLYFKLSSYRWDVPVAGQEGYKLQIFSNCGYTFDFEKRDFVRVTDFDNDTWTITLKAYAARTYEQHSCRLVFHDADERITVYFTIVQDGLPETFTSADGTFEFHIADWEYDDDEHVEY